VEQIWNNALPRTARPPAQSGQREPKGAHLHPAGAAPAAPVRCAQGRPRGAGGARGGRGAPGGRCEGHRWSGLESVALVLEPRPRSSSESRWWDRWPSRWEGNRYRGMHNTPRGVLHTPSAPGERDSSEAHTTREQLGQVGGASVGREAGRVALRGVGAGRMWANGWVVGGPRSQSGGWSVGWPLSTSAANLLCAP
jgi:hypothetical protein